MQLHQFKNITYTGYRLSGRTLYYEVCRDATITTYSVKIPTEVNKDVFFAYYRLHLVCEAYTQAILSEKVYVNIPLSEAQVDFCNRIKAPYYSGVSVMTGNLLMSPSSIGEVYIQPPSDVEDTFQEVVLKENNVTLAFSGGKEALLSQCLIEEAGMSVDKIHSMEEVDTVEGLKSALELSCLYDMRDTRSLDDTSSFFRESVWHNPSWTLKRVILALIHAVSVGNKYIAVGSEYSCSELTFSSYGGALSFGHSWAQSIFCFKDFERYLYLTNVPVKFFSAVQNMDFLMEELTLYKKYPKKAEFQISCERDYYNKETKRFDPCYSCIKCDILNAVLVGINKCWKQLGLKAPIESRFIFDTSVITVHQNPVHYKEHYLSPEELSAVENLLRGVVTESEFNLKFDQFHELTFLPSKVAEVIEKINN